MRFSRAHAGRARGVYPRLPGCVRAARHDPRRPSRRRQSEPCPSHYRPAPVCQGRPLLGARLQPGSGAHAAAACRPQGRWARLSPTTWDNALDTIGALFPLVQLARSGSAFHLRPPPLRMFGVPTYGLSDNEEFLSLPIIHADRLLRAARAWHASAGRRSGALVSARSAATCAHHRPVSAHSQFEHKHTPPSRRRGAHPAPHSCQGKLLTAGLPCQVLDALAVARSVRHRLQAGCRCRQAAAKHGSPSCADCQW
jgi:hypothetical protein